MGNILLPSLFFLTSNKQQCLKLVACFVVIAGCSLGLFLSYRSRPNSPISTAVQAQEAPASQEEIRHKQRLAAEIEALNQDLLAELGQYKQDERQFRIAHNQYQDLQTLGSIEQAVAAAKKVMLSRNQVIRIYLNILHLQLIETEGVELHQREAAVSLLEADQQQLSDFEERLTAASRREQINQLAAEFEPLGSQLYENSHYALNILAIGRLQSVYDKAVAIRQDLDLEPDTKQGQHDQTQRQRDLDEIDRLLTEISSSLREAWSQAASHQTRERSQTFYRNLTRDLSPTYAKLSQLIAYYQELEGVRP